MNTTSFLLLKKIKAESIKIKILAFINKFPATKHIGKIDNKKLKRAAACRVNPSIKPAVIVMPERDVPGTRANAWAKPIHTASRKPISLSPRF